MKQNFMLGSVFSSFLVLFATSSWCDLNFEFSQIVETGLQGSTIDSGDLDGDGDIDLAVANIFSHNISIVLNDGTGNFTQTLNLPLQNGLLHPVALAVGDIDGDGLDDIAIGQIQKFAEVSTIPFDFPALVVWFNNGNRTFTQVKVDDNLFGVPSSVFIADYDNDGMNDVVMGNNGTQSFEGLTIITVDAGIDLFKNTGNRTFAASKKIERQGAFVDEIVFDFNKDGFTDIFGINQGIPNFTQNGELKLLDTGVAVFIGSTAGILPLIEFELPYAPHDLDSADFNGDGLTDIAVSLLGESDVFSVISFLGRNASIEIYQNAGPILSPVKSIPVTGVANAVNAEDFDLDGDIDLIVTTQEIQVMETGNLLIPRLKLIQNDGGTFTEVASLALQEEPGYSCKGDFDRDGDIDIAVLCSIESTAAASSNNGRVYVFKNNAASAVPSWELY